MLVARGHLESRVENRLGANLLRVFVESWQPARSA